MLSGWLKELALRNIPPISLTLDTFHLLSGWLKDLAPANIRSIFVTLPALTKSRGAGRRRGSLVVPLCLAFSFLLFSESYNLLMLTRLLVVFVKGLHRRDLPLGRGSTWVNLEGVRLLVRRRAVSFVYWLFSSEQTCRRIQKKLKTRELRSTCVPVRRSALSRRLKGIVRAWLLGLTSHCSRSGCCR